MNINSQFMEALLSCSLFLLLTVTAMAQPNYNPAYSGITKNSTLNSYILFPGEDYSWLNEFQVASDQFKESLGGWFMVHNYNNSSNKIYNARLSFAKEMETDESVFVRFAISADILSYHLSENSQSIYALSPGILIHGQSMFAGFTVQNIFSASSDPVKVPFSFHGSGGYIYNHAKKESSLVAGIYLQYTLHENQRSVYSGEAVISKGFIRGGLTYMKMDEISDYNFRGFSLGLVDPTIKGSMYIGEYRGQHISMPARGISLSLNLSSRATGKYNFAYKYWKVF